MKERFQAADTQHFSVCVHSGADFDARAQLMSLLASAVSVEEIAEVDLLVLLFSVPSASQSSESEVAHTRLIAAPQRPKQVLVTSNLR